MKYIGKLYGKLGGKYFDTGHTAEDYDNKLDDFKKWCNKNCTNALSDGIDLAIENYRKTQSK